MGDVVQLDIKPKTLTKSYKRHKYTVSYVPATKKWSWDVEIVMTTHYGSVAETQVKAVRAAEKHIDGVLKMQGREAG